MPIPDDDADAETAVEDAARNHDEKRFASLPLVLWSVGSRS